MFSTNEDFVMDPCRTFVPGSQGSYRLFRAVSRLRTVYQRPCLGVSKAEKYGTGAYYPVCCLLGDCTMKVDIFWV